MGPRFVARRLVGGRRFRVFVPAAYAADRAWPVVLFLHGSGERGSDSLAPTRVGLGPALRRGGIDALAVFPQALPGAYWSAAALGSAVDALIDVEGAYRIDPERVYLAGVSMGAYGAWELAARTPERFAALVSICGGVESSRAPGGVPGVRLADGGSDPYERISSALRELPTWIFHGADDPVVPVAGARRMAAALAAAGAPVRYTELAHCGHNVWAPAFSSPDLWEWLLAQRRAVPLCAWRAGAGDRVESIP